MTSRTANPLPDGVILAFVVEDRERRTLVCTRPLEPLEERLPREIEVPTRGELLVPLVNDHPKRPSREPLDDAKFGAVDEPSGVRPESVAPKVAGVAQEVAGLDFIAHPYAELLARAASELEELVESIRPEICVNEHTSEGVRQGPTGVGVTGVAALIHIREKH